MRLECRDISASALSCFERSVPAAGRSANAQRVALCGAQIDGSHNCSNVGSAVELVASRQRNALVVVLRCTGYL